MSVGTPCRILKGGERRSVETGVCCEGAEGVGTICLG